MSCNRTDNSHTTFQHRVKVSLTLLPFFILPKIWSLAPIRICRTLAPFCSPRCIPGPLMFILTSPSPLPGCELPLTRGRQWPFVFDSLPLICPILLFTNVPDVSLRSYCEVILHPRFCSFKVAVLCLSKGQGDPFWYFWRSFFCLFYEFSPLPYSV